MLVKLPTWLKTLLNRSGRSQAAVNAQIAQQGETPELLMRVGVDASRVVLVGSKPGPPSVVVVYRGSVPDQFKLGRQLVVSGRLQNGVFVAKEGSMLTKCPSKYAPKKSSSTPAY